MHQKDLERDLLEQVSQHDEKAFKSLFDIYHERLFNYILRIIKSQQLAEELVMDVFMKIWLGKQMVLEIDNFEAFLFRIAHNKTIDFLRTAAKDPKFQDVLWDQMQVITGDQADSPILHQEFEAKLRQAIIRLSPRRRKVFQLSRENEMTHDQIAGLLGLSKHTVNNHIVEAQRFIRTYLSDKYNIALLILLISNITSK